MSIVTSVLQCYAIGSVLRGCYALGSRGVGLGLQVHGLVSKTVYAFDVVVCNVLISLYGGRGVYGVSG